MPVAALYRTFQQDMNDLSSYPLVHPTYKQKKYYIFIQVNNCSHQRISPSIIWYVEREKGEEKQRWDPG